MNKEFIIAIVDDDEIAQFTLGKMIEKKEIAKQILSFSDGESAFDFVKLNMAQPALLPDAILLDLNMPVMDGWQFLDEFMKMKADLPKPILIYIVTSSVDEVDISRAKALDEISGYLIKPILPEHVKLIVEMLASNAERRFSSNGS